MPTATCLTPLTAIIITESFLVSLGVGLCFIDLLPLLAVDIYSTVNKFVRLDLIKIRFNKIRISLLILPFDFNS